MKITDVRTTLLTGPCTNDPFLSEIRQLRSAAFIELYTDVGVVGLGETYAGYFCPENVPSIVDFFKPILIGQTADDPLELYRRMVHCGSFWCRVGLGQSVLSGIEAALWDLKGKMLGQPVHELLGGCKHQRLNCYASGASSNYPKDRLAEKIEYYRSLGINAVKLGVGYSTIEGKAYVADGAEAADFEADKLNFVRERFGSDFQLMLDGHMDNSCGSIWDCQTALKVLAAVEPYGLLFFEEPLPYTDPSGYAELCEQARVPVAGGECLAGEWEWRMFVEQDCFDVGQPDASFMGGLGPFMVVARLLEDRGHKIATHAWGAGGSLMQNIHCGFACANTIILEVPPAFGPLHEEIMGDSFVMSDGCILPPTTPGLGITLTDDIKSRFPFVPGTGEFNDVPGKILTT